MVTKSSFIINIRYISRIMVTNRTSCLSLLVTFESLLLANVKKFHHYNSNWPEDQTNLTENVKTKIGHVGLVGLAFYNFAMV